MNLNDFQTIFAELTAVYGDKCYPKPIGARLWHQVSKIDAQDFRRVVDNVIMEHNRAPTIGVIAKACYPFTKLVREREQRKAVEILEARAGRCKLCDAQGMVFVFLRSDPAKEFSFRCNACDAPSIRNVWSGMPLWRDELVANYMTLKEKMAMEVEQRREAEAEKQVRRAAIKAEIDAMRRQGAADAVESEDFGQWGF